jgi:hypothetical protein
MNIPKDTTTPNAKKDDKMKTRNCVVFGGKISLYGFGNNKAIIKIGKHLSIALDNLLAIPLFVKLVVENILNFSDINRNEIIHKN